MLFGSNAILKKKKSKKSKAKQSNITLLRGGVGISLTWAQMFGLVEGIRIVKLHLPQEWSPRD